MKQLVTLLILTCIVNTTYCQSIKNETLVFSTATLKTSKSIKLNKKEFKISINKKCKEEGEPPYECFTEITFSDNGYPKLKASGDCYAFATADINLDGNDEFVLLSKEGGNWRNVVVYTLGEPSMTSSAFWYQPFESFMWFPGYDEDKMCDAKIYLKSNKKQVVVYTTDANDENFKCIEKLSFDWKME
jgi:hypothetical protein